MMTKLLDDAKAAGFYVSDEQISVHGNSNDIILNNMIAKFAALQQPQWISVKDRLPDEFRKVIVIVNRLNYESNYTDICHMQKAKWMDDGFPVNVITNWMPLPIQPINTEGI